MLCKFRRHCVYKILYKYTRYSIIVILCHGDSTMKEDDSIVTHNRI